ncbi:15841_t:CDS:1, partial [Funneliformis caledonium]
TAKDSKEALKKKDKKDNIFTSSTDTGVQWPINHLTDREEVLNQ